MKELAIIMAACASPESIIEKIKESCEEYLMESDPQKRDIHKVLFCCSLLAINNKCDGNPEKVMELIGRAIAEEPTEKQTQSSEE